MSEQLDKDLVHMKDILDAAFITTTTARTSLDTIINRIKHLDHEYMMYSQKVAAFECGVLEDKFETAFDAMTEQYNAASRAVAQFEGELHPENVAPPRKKEQWEDLPMAMKDGSYEWKR